MSTERKILINDAYDRALLAIVTVRFVAKKVSKHGFKTYMYDKLKEEMLSLASEAPYMSTYELVK